MVIARQDRKDKPRVAIGSKLIANIVSFCRCGSYHHDGSARSQIQGYFDIPVDHLTVLPFLYHILSNLRWKILPLARPDVGSAKSFRGESPLYLRRDGGDAVINTEEGLMRYASMVVIGDGKGIRILC